MRKTLLIALFALLTIGLAFGQSAFYTETMGSVTTTTTIAAHEAANGFSVVDATYSGTADIRSTTTSTGYTGASGGANVFFTNTIGRTLLIEGVNTSSYTNITMTFGHYKSTLAANNELAVEVSADGTNWTALSYSRPTGTGTQSWLQVSPTGDIPSTPNLRIRFTQTSATPQFRIDDIVLAGNTSTPTPTINVTSALNAFSTYTGTPSASQSYTLSGTALTGNINIAALSGYAYSTDDTNWSSTLSLANTYSGPVYVRLTGASTGSFSGDIVHSSTGASDAIVSATGTVSPETNPEANVEDFENHTLSGTSYVDGSFVGNNGITWNYVQVTGEQDYPIQNKGILLRRLSSSSKVYSSAIAGGIGSFSLQMRKGFTGTGDRQLALYINDTHIADSQTFGAVSGADPTIHTFSVNDINIAGNVVIEVRNIQGTGTTNRQVVIDNLTWTPYGELPPTPVIHASTTELDPLACIQDNPSEEIRSYTLYGENTTSPIIVTAPIGFQVATSTSGAWLSSLELPSSFDGTIYVRMFATSTGEFEGVITHTSGTATQVNVSVSGECFAPSVVWNITQNLTPFTAQAGVVSSVQSYSLSATNATGDLVVSTEAPFELSTTGTGNWLTELSLAYNFSGNVYVRMNASTPGIYTKNINHSSYEASPTSFEISGNATPPAGVYATDLFFSEYIEGGSNNKAIEIFNGTGYPVNLSDYKVNLYSNGSASVGNTQTLSGTLAHGDVYVIANTNANAAILALADITSAVTNYNGDDAIALVKISTGAFVDIFGVIGQDPGTQWTAAGGFSTLDKTLVRKPTVVSGVTTNPAISTPLVTTDFVTLGTEWLLYAQDTITDLGMHTFNPGGGEMAETPMFDPAGGAYINPINVSITSDTPSASIYYTTNGDIPTDSSTLYTAPIAISSNTTLKAIAYKDGYLPSSVASATYSFPVNVANIAALRASAQGATIYRLTGEAVLTFQQANRNQKYVQDATGAVVIDDPSGIITSTYNLYDGITGITGTLNNYSSLIQFTPVADPGAATSSSNVVVPEVRTLAEITTNDQAKLLKIMNVTLDATSGNFLSTAQNITATDASGTLTMRTFPAADYAATPIPAEPRNIICLGGQFGTTMQFSPRFLSDFEIPSGSLDAPVVTITENAGNVVLDWAAVTGAASYRIEASDDPYTGYSPVTTTANLTWSGAASTAKKFYRVIALP